MKSILVFTMFFFVGCTTYKFSKSSNRQIQQWCAKKINYEETKKDLQSYFKSDIQNFMVNMEFLNAQLDGCSVGVKEYEKALVK